MLRALTAATIPHMVSLLEVEARLMLGRAYEICLRNLRSDE